MHDGEQAEQQHLIFIWETGEAWMQSVYRKENKNLAFHLVMKTVSPPRVQQEKSTWISDHVEIWQLMDSNSKLSETEGTATPYQR